MMNKEYLEFFSKYPKTFNDCVVYLLNNEAVGVGDIQDDQGIRKILSKEFKGYEMDISFSIKVLEL